MNPTINYKLEWTDSYFFLSTFMWKIQFIPCHLLEIIVNPDTLFPGGQ
jgi:hypothetical protein